MNFRRPSATALGSLAIYLAGLIGTGLHHHDHGSHAAEPAGQVATMLEDASENPADSCTLDPGSCPVCALALQAQAVTPAVMLGMAWRPAEAVICCDDSRPPLVPSRPAKARAPPAL